MGNVIVWAHVVRDSAGNINSGSVDFDIACRFSGAVTVPGGVSGNVSVILKAGNASSNAVNIAVQ